MTDSPLRQEGILGPLFKLAWPVLLANLLHVLVEYVDTFLAGRFLAGAAPLAAISLIRYVTWLIFTLFAFVSVGAVALVSRSVGAGNLAQASAAARASLVLGFYVSLGIMALGFAAARPLTELMQLESEAADLAVQYLYYVLPVLPALMLEEVGIACLRGAGDTVSGLYAMLVVNAVNIVVSAALLLGTGPLPELGWPGLAIGTVCGRLTGGAIIFVLLLRGRSGIKLSWRPWQPQRDILVRLLRIGVPGGIDAVTIVACHFWYVSLINRLGTLSAAAHAVGISIEALSYMPGAAFQVAAATLVGQSLGANNPRRAKRAVLAACAWCGGFMSVCGMLFFFWPEMLVGIFLGERNAPLLELTARLLPIVALSMPALAVSMVLSGALRGAGDTRWPLVITLVGFLGVRIPLAYSLSQTSFTMPGTSWELSGYGLGIAGAWLAMLIDVHVRSLLLVVRFWQGAWQRVEV